MTRGLQCLLWRELRYIDRLVPMQAMYLFLVKFSFKVHASLLQATSQPRVDPSKSEWKDGQKHLLSETFISVECVPSVGFSVDMYRVHRCLPHLSACTYLYLWRLSPRGQLNQYYHVSQGGTPGSTALRGWSLIARTRN